MGENLTVREAGSLDPAAWLDRHGDVLYRYALLRLRDGDAAEDAIQETFLAALQGKDRFEGRSAERTWLIGILKRKIIDRMRRTSQEYLLSEIEASGECIDEQFNRHGFWQAKLAKWGASADEAVERGEFRQVLADCLSRMRPALAQVFVLRQMDKLETKEICEILGISETNLWTLLHRARVRLRACLERNWFGGAE